MASLNILLAYIPGPRAVAMVALAAKPYTMVFGLYQLSVQHPQPRTCSCTSAQFMLSRTCAVSVAGGVGSSEATSDRYGSGVK